MSCKVHVAIRVIKPLLRCKVLIPGLPFVRVIVNTHIVRGFVACSPREGGLCVEQRMIYVNLDGLTGHSSSTKEVSIPSFGRNFFGGQGIRDVAFRPIISESSHHSFVRVRDFCHVLGGPRSLAESLLERFGFRFEVFALLADFISGSLISKSL